MLCQKIPKYTTCTIVCSEYRFAWVIISIGQYA